MIQPRRASTLWLIGAPLRREPVFLLAPARSYSTWSPRQLTDFPWSGSHARIMCKLARLPARQWVRVRAEDLEPAVGADAGGEGAADGDHPSGQLLRPAAGPAHQAWCPLPEIRPAQISESLRVVAAGLPVSVAVRRASAMEEVRASTRVQQHDENWTAPSGQQALPLSVRSQIWTRLSQIATNHPAERTERTSCVSSTGYPVSDTHDNLRTGAGLTFCTGMPESGAASAGCTRKR
jgi:hypothetical protein